MSFLSGSTPGTSALNLNQSGLSRTEMMNIEIAKEPESFCKIKKASTAIEMSAEHIPMGSTLSEFDIWYLSVADAFIKKGDLDLFVRQEEDPIPKLAGFDEYLTVARQQAEFQSRSSVDSEMRDTSIVDARSRMQEVKDLIRICRSKLTSFKEARTIEESLQSLNDDLCQKSIMIVRFEDRNMGASSFPLRTDCLIPGCVMVMPHHRDHQLLLVTKKKRVHS
jgi:hypothetical protein